MAALRLESRPATGAGLLLALRLVQREVSWWTRARRTRNRPSREVLSKARAADRIDGWYFPSIRYLPPTPAANSRAGGIAVWFYTGSICYRSCLAIVVSLLSPLLSPCLIVHLITVIVAAIVEIIVIPFLVLGTVRIGRALAGLGRCFR